jgi:hypothetical protein
VRLRNAGDDARNPVRTGEDGPRGHAIRTAADVRRVLAQEIEHVRTNPDLDPLRKAGLLAQLARVALRAIELSTLEARVEAVEAALRLRKDSRPSKEER